MGWAKYAVGGIGMTMIVVACGGDPGSKFGQNGQNDPNDPFSPGGMINGGNPPPDLTKCATSSATPSPIPVNLVFMFDQSGSMSQNSKWTSCVQGLTGFFSDPKSKGLNASLQYFPQGTQCSSSVFQNPSVAMRPLPDSQSFSSSMASHMPGGGTPTLPAEQGAIAYAQSIASSHPGEKVAIVLVTDGDPNDCSSTPQNVAAMAMGVANKIPTYVIGVGPSLQNLDTIAMGGGTMKATIVQTNNPSQIVQDFENALNAIRGLTLACEYTIPSPGSGQMIDFTKVNVVFTPTNAPMETLQYSQDCSNPNGWRYDNAMNPTKILLCQNACNNVQKDKSGKIDVVFGCKTNGLPTN